MARECICYFYLFILKSVQFGLQEGDLANVGLQSFLLEHPMCCVVVNLSDFITVLCCMEAHFHHIVQYVILMRMYLRIMTLYLIFFEIWSY